MFYTKPQTVKKLRVSFDVADSCIEKHELDQYLLLFFANEKYERMFLKVKYLVGEKKEYFNFFIITINENQDYIRC